MEHGAGSSGAADGRQPSPAPQGPPGSQRERTAHHRGTKPVGNGLYRTFRDGDGGPGRTGTRQAGAFAVTGGPAGPRRPGRRVAGHGRTGPMLHRPGPGRADAPPARSWPGGCSTGPVPAPAPGPAASDGSDSRDERGCRDLREPSPAQPAARDGIRVVISGDAFTLSAPEPENGGSMSTMM